MNLTLQPKKAFQPNQILHDRFQILGKLDNKKHSSEILKGWDKTDHDFVVIKITSATYREKNKIVTKILQKLAGGVGVPKIIWRGMEDGKTITVTECLGPNLKKLFLLMNKQFTIQTICMIAIQVLNTLQGIHEKDYVCCNIMPKEILISLHKKSQVLYITDYKQARKVKSDRAGLNDQINHAANKAILNKFSSVNLHLGLPASRKDDLESLAYILIYFFKKGNLFDRTSKALTKEEKIKYYEQQKLGIIPETFCQGLPTEMGTFLTYIKSLQTNQSGEKLDFEYMRKIFRTLLNKYTSAENFQYDWMDKAIIVQIKDKKQQENSSKNPSELTINPSPRSEVLSDADDRANESPELRGALLPEHDFGEVDEFMSISRKSSSSRVQQIGIFDEKVKTISHIKRASLISAPVFDVHAKIRSSSDTKDIKSTTTEELSWEIAGEKIEEYHRPKIKSATDTFKVSKFAKVYTGNNESKSS